MLKLLICINLTFCLINLKNNLSHWVNTADDFSPITILIKIKDKAVQYFNKWVCQSLTEQDMEWISASRQSFIERAAESLICLYALLITHGWLGSNPQRARGKAHVGTGPRAAGRSALPYLNTLEGGRRRVRGRGDHWHRWGQCEG